MLAAVGANAPTKKRISVKISKFWPWLHPHRTKTMHPHALPMSCTPLDFTLASPLTTSAITRKGLNSLIILGAWILWNHRNRCLFDGAAPNMVESLIHFGDERRVWMMAGARGLSHLMAPLLGA
jgi:hypothetical protein